MSRIYISNFILRNMLIFADADLIVDFMLLIFKFKMSDFIFQKSSFKDFPVLMLMFKFKMSDFIFQVFF